MYKPLILDNTSLWFYDSYTPHLGLAIHVKAEVAHTRTKYQQVRILDTFELGKILVLNQYMYQAQQGTELTEMLIHVPFNSGKTKKKILVIGGGDGVSLSQIVQYPQVEQIDVIDIDEELTKFCRKNFFIPESIWQDKRVHFYFQDGFDFLFNSHSKYDVILSAVSEIYNADGSEGMAYRLYTKDFYRLVFEHLTAEGMFVSDGTTVHYTSEGYEWWKYGKEIKKVFPIVKPYHFNSKRMPGGEFVLLFSSKKYDPVNNFKWQGLDLKTIYYNQEIHKAAFVLSESMKKKWI